MSSTATARLNWVTVILFAGGAAALGLAPAASMLHRPRVSLWFALGIAVLALFAPRKLTRRLTTGQYLFEFGQMLQYAAMIGLFWMAVYWLLFGLSRLIHWMSGGSWLLNGDSIVFQVSLVSTATISFLMPLGLWDDVRKRMALVSDGGDPWYPAVNKSTWKNLLGCLLLFSLPILFTPHWLAMLLLEFALVAIPAQYTIDEKSAQPRAVRAVGRLFEACSYSVTLHPQVGDPELDPILKPIDIFAESEFASYAVSVILGDAMAEPVSWKAASNLRTAAALYAREPAKVKCMLVLLGLAPDAGLTDFGQREKVQILQLSVDAAQEADAAVGGSALQEIAARYLQLKPEPKGAAL